MIYNIIAILSRDISEIRKTITIEEEGGSRLIVIWQSGSMSITLDASRLTAAQTLISHLFI